MKMSLILMPGGALFPNGVLTAVFSWGRFFEGKRGSALSWNRIDK